jgi:hypothetical protein
MGLLDWIERMREKPEPVRRRAAFMLAGSITFVIVLVWLTSGLLLSSTSNDVVYSTQESQQAAPDFWDTLKQFKEGAGQQFEDLQGVAEVFQGAFSTSSSPTP